MDNSILRLAILISCLLTGLSGDAWASNGSSFTNANDFDGDGVDNDQDVCLLVSDPEQLDGDGDGHGDACSNQCPNPTLQVLRFGLTIGQLQEVFTYLAAGPFPGWNVQASGWSRIVPAEGTFLKDLQQTLIRKIWQGKTFFTGSKGGFETDRIACDNSFVPRAVFSAPSPIDRRPAIQISTLPFSYVLEQIREVEPGLYLGFAYFRLPFLPPIPFLTFFLDMQCPEVLPEEVLGICK